MSGPRSALRSKDKAHRKLTCAINPATANTTAAARDGLGPIAGNALAIAPTNIWHAPYNPAAVPVRWTFTLIAFVIAPGPAMPTPTANRQIRPPSDHTERLP